MDTDPVAPNNSSERGVDDDSHLDSIKRSFSNIHRPQMGRKGDTRMHKAVAAKLENPSLSLIEALRIGGFDYPENAADDAFTVDSDNITLGQRKNQLNRRLRTARIKSRMAPFPDVVSDTSSVSVEAQSDLQHSSQAPSPASEDTSSRGTKRRASLLQAPDDSICEIVGAHQDQTLANVKPRMAKFHPQYHPILVYQAQAKQRSSWSPPNAPASFWAQEEDAQGATYAENPAGAGALGVSGLCGQIPTCRQGAIAAAEAMANSGGRRLSSLSSLNHHAIPSGVAVASLNASATSVGLSLEQLAVALSCTPTLSNVLEDSIPDTRQQLALNLFQAECRTLYERCMLLAGYIPQEVQESSEAYKQFATMAWSEEAKRLKQRIGLPASPPSPRDGPELAAGYALRHAQPTQVDTTDAHAQAPKRQPTEAEIIDAHSHVHGHAHAHVHQVEQREKEACFDGRHVHRLEGKCGHRAVVHQPEGAPAHVDFVVDGSVECYEGIKPVGTNAALWPSRYKCSEISCPSDSSPHEVRLDFKFSILQLFRSHSRSRSTSRLILGNVRRPRV